MTNIQVGGMTEEESEINDIEHSKSILERNRLLRHRKESEERKALYKALLEEKETLEKLFQEHDISKYLQDFSRQHDDLCQITTARLKECADEMTKQFAKVLENKLHDFKGNVTEVLDAYVKLSLTEFRLKEEEWKALTENVIKARLEI